jgi:hypothetical protein
MIELESKIMIEVEEIHRMKIMKGMVGFDHI